MRVLLISILCLGFWTSCGEPELDRIDRIVTAKLEESRAKYERLCIQELIKNASEAVDSFIIAKALSDTTNIIVKPSRPDVPSLEIPDLDTLGIQPLFEKIDTLQ